VPFHVLLDASQLFSVPNLRKIMNKKSSRILAIALLPLGLAAFTACSSGPQPQETVVRTATGEEITDTYRIDATVVAVDSVKRKVTVAHSAGKKTTFKAGPNQDLSQLQVGDRLQATLTEDLAVSLLKGDKAAPSASASDVVAAAATNGEAAGLMGDQVTITAKVSAIDTKKRKVTMQLPDGTSKSVKAAKNIDLANVSVGDDVKIQLTEALAIDLQKK